MPATAVKPRPGRASKSTSATAQALKAANADKTQHWRRISQQDRRFVALYVESGMKDAELAARAAGFKRPGIGYKLTERLAELIANERVRQKLVEAMSLDEALGRVADLGRSAEDEKTQLSALVTVLKVHGALSDKPLSPEGRRVASKELDSLLGQIREKLGDPRSKVRVRALERVVEAEIEGQGESEEE